MALPRIEWDQEALARYKADNVALAAARRLRNWKRK